QAPFVATKSGAISEHLCYHFGKHLLPKRNKGGGEAGVESDEFRRNKHFMHYTEALYLLVSKPLFLTISISTRLSSALENAPLPFFLKPLTHMVANKVNGVYLHLNFAAYFASLEDHLKTSSGRYSCGKKPAEGDFMMMFLVEVCKSVSGLTRETVPFL
ncbi:hypothetical protein BJ875DRAFT_345201, partial [Amylocarpus encephaloides]